MVSLPALSLPQLKVTCTSTDCANALHCFRRSRKAAERRLGAKCRECNIDLVDWPRLHLRNLSDALFTFVSLKHEFIRHYYWHIPINARLAENAHRKGSQGMAVAVKRRIHSSVGGIPGAWDGRQTPLEGSPKANVIHFGQHAVASCCRKCIEIWHGIPKERALTELEIQYLSELTLLYVQERLPLLNEANVPPRLRSTRPLLIGPAGRIAS